MPLSVDAMSDLSASDDRSIDIATKNGATSARRAMMMTERLFFTRCCPRKYGFSSFQWGKRDHSECRLTRSFLGVISALTAEEKWSVASLCRIPSPFLRCDTRAAIIHPSLTAKWRAAELIRSSLPLFLPLRSEGESLLLRKSRRSSSMAERSLSVILSTTGSVAFQIGRGLDDVFKS